MSRRRRPKRPPLAPAPNDGTLLGHPSDADLVRELGEKTLTAAIAALAPDAPTARPCPRRGRPVPLAADAERVLALGFARCLEEASADTERQQGRG